MYKKILVPLDGSDRAEAILPHVEKLAKLYGSEVLFMRTVEGDYFVPGYQEVVDISGYEQEYARRKKEVESYLESLRLKFNEKGISNRPIVSYDSVVQSILNTAEKEEVDLIALASHGRSGLARAFYGSVASGVLNRIDRPLLIIRSN
ncbi:universal stress protein [Desulfococcus sp.]|uniref:universal stress protein n=1 Tax=Desulfococcus sp. TaxID=2025834 RepID=UPI00359427F3